MALEAAFYNRFTKVCEDCKQLRQVIGLMKGRERLSKAYHYYQTHGSHQPMEKGAKRERDWQYSEERNTEQQERVVPRHCVQRGMSPAVIVRRALIYLCEVGDQPDCA